MNICILDEIATSNQASIKANWLIEKNLTKPFEKNLTKPFSHDICIIKLLDPNIGKTARTQYFFLATPSIST